MNERPDFVRKDSGLYKELINSSRAHSVMGPPDSRLVKSPLTHQEHIQFWGLQTVDSSRAH